MGVICKYKYDSSIYADFIPEFNSGYSDYTITDEVEGNIITRTIESDKLPTLMRFGSNLTTYVEGSEVALFEILEMNTNGLTSCYQMFRYCINLTSITCEWDTSKVATMQYMFSNCNKLASLDVSNWDVSKVTGMRSIFNSCFKLTTLDVSDWNTSKVTDMQQMFYNCNGLTSLDVSNWDTGNVTNMVSMFHNCKNLTSLDVSNFNTSNVISMYNMFCGCHKLISLDVSNFDTSNVTNMSSMFNNCNKLTTLDVSNFDTSNVADMYCMFLGCNKLTTLDVSNWNTSNVTNTSSMFNRCNNLIALDLSNWNTIKVIGMENIFYNCTNLTTLDVSNWDTNNVTSMGGMFHNCSKLTSLDISGFDTSKVTNTTDMFANTNSLEVIVMFNNDIDTVNVVGNLTSTTIYVDESLDQSQYTGTAPLKVYKEEKLEIKLNSPLLEGDTIEVVDGKLCHVHRWDKVVLDGSENINWVKHNNSTDTMFVAWGHKPAWYNASEVKSYINDRFSKQGSSTNNIEGFNMATSGFAYMYIYNSRLIESTIDGFKQWLSENPITVVYRLAEPYYEDITPLQSSIILKTFLESSMTIDTILPIETKLSYRTNVPSISTLSTRATELAESDNVIHNLMNIIDDEVDE